MLRRLTVCIVCLLPLTGTSVLSQSPAVPQSRIIAGRVTATDPADALPNARVAITSDASRDPVVLRTDKDGGFSTRVAGRTIVVTVTKTGYAPARVEPSGAAPIVIRLRPTAAITGRVVDASGVPVISQRVEVVRDRALDGGASNALLPVTTDDRGEFRIAGLGAGRYRVFVPLPPERATFVNGQPVFAQPRIFAPGVSEPDVADVIELRDGEERGGVDVALPMEAGPQGALSATPNRMAPSPIEVVGEPVTGPEAVSVRGRIIDVAGRPVADATVQLRGRNVFRTMQSERDGGYSFTGLPAGNVNVIASKPRHTALGRAGRSPQTPLANLAPSAGEALSGVDLVLSPWSTLTGRVVDEYGAPVQRARVQLLTVRYERGRRQLVGAGAFVRLTDDLGVYRLWDIVPGRYLVSATVGEVLSAELPGYGRSYYPGTADPSGALPVVIGPSLEVSGIDIALVPQPTYRIYGRMFDSSGRPTNNGSLTLAPSVRSASPLGVAIGAKSEPDGSFEFANVTPGLYVIQASGGQTSAAREGEAAVLAVAVTNQDVSGIALRRSRGAKIIGRVTTLGITPGNFAGIDVTTIPSDADFDLPNSRSVAFVDREHTFELSGILGPRRIVVRGVPGGWTVDRIEIDGRDITDVPLNFRQDAVAHVDVVLTNRTSVLQGRVNDRNARALARQPLVVFTTDRSRWFAGSRYLLPAITGVDGAYRVEGLPAGTYYVAPRVGEMAGDDAWSDPVYLESLIPLALTVSLSDGQTSTANLRLEER